MKAKIFLCARDIPGSHRTTFASVSVVDGPSLGHTEVANNTRDHVFEKEFVLDTKDENMNFIVRIFTPDGHEIGHATFNLAKLLGAKSNTIGEKMDGGGKIFAHVHCYGGTLRYKLGGKGLKNVEGRLGISRITHLNVSDPFYVVQGTSGNIVYVSGYKSNDLDPVWPEASIDLGVLCDGNLDGIIRVIIYDHNKTREHKLMGVIETTVNEMMSKCKSSESISVTRKGKKSGQLNIISAKVSGLVTPQEAKEAARKAIGKAYLEEMTAKAAAKTLVAVMAHKRAKAAAIAFEKNENSALLAAEQLLDADAEAFEATETAKKIADEVKGQSGISGTFKLQLRGQKLNGQNAIGQTSSLNSYFVIERPLKQGQGVHWENVYTSETLGDDCGSSWQATEMELDAICDDKLSDSIRIRVFNHESFGEEELIGHCDTSIERLIKAKEAGDLIPLRMQETLKMHIAVSEAEAVNFLDPKRAAEEAKAKAEEANYFALGKIAVAQIKSREAALQREIAENFSEAAKNAAEEAQALRISRELARIQQAH